GGRSKRNVDCIILFILSKEAALALLQHSDDLVLLAGHQHFASRNLVAVGKEGLDNISPDDHDIAPVEIIYFTDETTFLHHRVTDRSIVGRHSIQVAPFVSLFAVRQVVIYAPDVTGEGHVLNRRGLLKDRLGIFGCEGLPRPFLAVARTELKAR